ncbi:hypothetical protein ACWEQ7_19415 [Streptomyces sp. NPDC004069]
MAEEQADNVVKLGDDGELLYFDGKDWVPYPDVDDGGGFSPGLLIRDDDR